MKKTNCLFFILPLFVAQISFAENKTVTSESKVKGTCSDGTIDKNGKYIATGEITVGPIANEETIKQYKPKLKIEYVLEKAQEYLLKEENNNAYFIRSIEYNNNVQTWDIHFQNMTNPRIYFGISIDDKTDEIKLLYGA